MRGHLYTYENAKHPEKGFMQKLSGLAGKEKILIPSAIGIIAVSSMLIWKYRTCLSNLGFQKKIENSYITKALFEEGYTLEKDQFDSQGFFTDTQKEEKDPEWQIRTSQNDIITITESQYKQYKTFWQNEECKEESYEDEKDDSDNSHSRCETKYPGEESKMIAMSQEKIEIMSRETAAPPKYDLSDWQYLLRPYPDLKKGNFHNNYFDRVITANIPNMPPKWSLQLDNELDRKLAKLANNKFNIIVYAVPLDSPNIFPEVLMDQWQGGSLNDIIIIMGITEYPEVKWVKTIANNLREQKNTTKEQAALFEELLSNTVLKSPIQDPQKFTRNIIKKCLSQPR